MRLGELFSENYTVFVYGQENYHHDKVHICKDLQECLCHSDIIISGMPFSKDNVCVIAPYSEHEIRIDVLCEMLNHKIFIAGGIPIQFYEDKTIEKIDLLQCEELTILNAIPTVEGVIKIAIEQTQHTVHESHVMIWGYGRIGKILCKRFQDLGANVYCVARKQADLAWIREQRCIPVEYSEVQDKVGKMDIIVNTVPSIVINERIIKNLKKQCLVIDVASNPGGVDKEIAKRYNINVITALGIPGKIAPLTSAKYIKKVVEGIIREKENS